MTLKPQPPAPSPTHEYCFDRYREGRLMAQGARVHACSEAEAEQKAKAVFHPWDERDTLHVKSPSATEPTRPAPSVVESRRCHNCREPIFKNADGRWFHRTGFIDSPFCGHGKLGSGNLSEVKVLMAVPDDEVRAADPSPQASPEPRAPTVSMQTLSDAGLNPFAVELLHESFSRKKDYAQWTGPNSFVFNGMRMTFEKQQHFESRVTAPVGHTESKPTYAVGVSVLLVNPDGEVLLGERIAGASYAVGMLSTPGGRIEQGEDMIDAAIRETLEETGLRIDAEDVKIIGFKEHFRFGSHYFMFYAEVRRWTGTLTNTESDKCKAWLWFPIAEIPENCTEPKDIIAALASPPQIAQPEPRIHALETAIANFLERRGRHEGDHDSAHTACSKCELAYIEAEQELDKAVAE